MKVAQPADVTQLLRRLQKGDRTSEEELIRILYHELRRLAARQMRKERADRTLQPTALVNEVYLRLMRTSGITWQDRAHFFGFAAQLMRQILVDHARAHVACKRGGGTQKLELDELLVFSPEKSAELVLLNEALIRLESRDPKLGKVVELRFFGGFAFQQIGEALQVSAKTAQRHWQLARAWLRAEVSN
jgi:RNA polymerase sigma factor (TIGR02999 family)